ncbi:hypothetical protein [uncultured Clostridium sp.]|uniref:hypothetical protein n=1 Tax=uncultured Clostridium sp. TaxID=59620 RepID=UPI0026EB63D1|nr:hypothetical protein [uncultured Clostridium sp.]
MYNVSDLIRFRNKPKMKKSIGVILAKLEDCYIVLDVEDEQEFKGCYPDFDILKFSTDKDYRNEICYDFRTEIDYLGIQQIRDCDIITAKDIMKEYAL